jgi:hypothetical protein
MHTENNTLIFDRRQLYPSLYNNNNNDNNNDSNNNDGNEPTTKTTINNDNNNNDTIASSSSSSLPLIGNAIAVSDYEIQSLLEIHAVDGYHPPQTDRTSCSYTIMSEQRRSVPYNNFNVSQQSSKLSSLSKSNAITKSSLNTTTGDSNVRTGNHTTINNSTTATTTSPVGGGGGGGVSTRQQSFTKPDIWGNIPLKEPKEPIVCPVCYNTIRVSEFAPHLDQCYGISSSSSSLFYTSTTTNGRSNSSTSGILPTTVTNINSNNNNNKKNSIGSVHFSN